MKHLFAAAFMLCAPVAEAQDLPMRTMVSGVAATDVLNIRSGPGAGFDKVGEIAPFATNVEVLEVRDGWGLVSTGEGNGWVSMRYLAELPSEEWSVPRPLTCLGTEPFWRLSLFPRGAEFDSPDTGRRDLSEAAEAVAPSGYLVRLVEGPTLERTLIVRAGQCSDGMSDRRFGMRGLVFVETPDGNRLLSGCCTFDHR